MKFRAWDKTDKRMIPPEQEFIPVKVTNIGVLRLDPFSKDTKWILMDNERFELMGSIGQPDENKIEIFRGDIIQGNIIEHSIETIGTIEYSSEYSAYVNRNEAGDTLLFKINNIKIISNKYMNPELLEDQ